MADSPSLFVLGSFVAACSVHVARCPEPGETARASAFIVEPGGKGLNLAVGARRLGAEVDGLLAVGDDVFAQMAAPALAAAGLPATMLRHYPGPSGAGVGFIDASGETSVAVYSGANGHLSAADVQGVAERIRHAQLVLAQFEISDAPIEAAFALARAAGATTILNPSPFRVPSEEILGHTSILVVNEAEARALFEGSGALDVPDPNVALLRPDPAALAAIFACGPRLLVITRGAKGAMAFGADGGAVTQPAFVIAAVDSLGCGDAFTAGLATGLLSGLPFPDGLRRAAACGALAACRRGVFDALPTAGALEALLAAREGDGATYPQGVIL